MDRRLYPYYERELQHIRESAEEFAREYPSAASRLGLESFEVQDPYVERLLEGFAFLTARVQLKLDAEFPRVTEFLLDTVQPHYLAPIPSMTVVQCQLAPDNPVGPEGFVLPARTLLRSEPVGPQHTRCEFRTGQPVTLWPLRITEAAYYSRDYAALRLPAGLGTRAAIRIRLATAGGVPFSQLGLDRLALFLHGPDSLPVRLYENLLARGRGLVLRPGLANPPWQQVVEAPAIRRMGLTADEALLPFDARSFQGYRLLEEYFAFPQRFLFVELQGLAEGVGRCTGEALDLIIPLAEADPALEGNVSAGSFRLFCTPAVNLFHRSAERIALSDRAWEFPIVVDRTRPLDFEVYRVQEVTGYGSRPDQRQRFGPFYQASDLEPDGGGAYFAVHRVERALTERERNPRIGLRNGSGYAGSDVYLSLVDARSAPYRSDLRQLGVECLCTNRDLPLLMPNRFTLEVSAPAVKDVVWLTQPTAPRNSRAIGEAAWRTISHLGLNYTSLAEAGEAGAEPLRDLLRLYADGSDPASRRQIEGVRGLTTRSMTARVGQGGPAAFARGLEVELLIDEEAFEGLGCFLLGSVLEEFFARYVSLNAFTQTVVRSTSRGELVRWPARLGQRPIL